MAEKIPWTLVLSSFVFIGMLVTKGSSLEIRITPVTATETETDSVGVTCTTVGSNLVAGKDLLVLELVGKDNGLIAKLQPGPSVTYGNDASNHYQAEGKLSPDSGYAALNVTVLFPTKAEDSGVYTCVLYYLDTAGIMQVERTSHNLTVVKSESSLQTRLTSMENEQSKLKQELQDLQDKVDFQSLFSVRNEKVIENPQNGMELVLTKVLAMKGPGYDNTTGVFTVPRKGIYNINLQTYIYGSEAVTHGVAMEIQVNNVNEALLGVGTSRHPPQGSVNIVLQLDIGDTVKAHVLAATPSVKLGDTFFSGYLIYAD